MFYTALPSGDDLKRFNYYIKIYFFVLEKKVRTRKDKWYTYSQLQSTTIKSNIWLWKIKLPGHC